MGADASVVDVDEWDVVGDEPGSGAGVGESDVDMCEVDVVMVKAQGVGSHESVVGENKGTWLGLRVRVR